ncbi:MAG: hypothetical protein AAF337_04385 [Pseudomonadota bacterium]
MIRSLILGAASFCLATTPVAANGLYNDFDANADWQNNGAAYAGAYLTYRFGSGLRTSKPALSYGFRAGLQPGIVNTRTAAPHWSQSVAAYGPQQSTPMRFNQPIQLDVLTIDFSERGFEKTNLVGVPVLAAQGNQGLWRLGADEGAEDEEGGVTAGKVLLYGLAGFGALILVGAVAFAASDPEIIPDFSSDD